MPKQHSTPLHTFVSPVSVEGPPKQCVELIIYDNDGPEGIFHRFRFKRSADAVKMLFDMFDQSELDEFNFELKNHWIR